MNGTSDEQRPDDLREDSGRDELALELLATTDAQVWARRFIETFGDRREEIDEGLMIGWFANAFGAAEMKQAQLAMDAKAVEEREHSQARQPYEVSQHELLNILFDITRGVAIGDTLEGSIVFTIGSPGHWDVRGQYRVGNLEGQGGVRVVGGDLLEEGMGTRGEWTP